MNYSYVLLSERDGRFYIGSTGDLRARMEKHKSGAVRSTAYRRPLRLIYYEACLSVEDAYRRERYLKSGRGGRYLKQRLAFWLSEAKSNKLERHYPMPTNALNCHSEERSRPQAGGATRNLLFHWNLPRTVHFVGNDMLYILAKRIFR